MSDSRTEGSKSAAGWWLTFDKTGAFDQEGPPSRQGTISETDVWRASESMQETGVEITEMPS